MGKHVPSAFEAALTAQMASNAISAVSLTIISKINNKFACVIKSNILLMMELNVFVLTNIILSMINVLPALLAAPNVLLDLNALHVKVI